MLIRKNIHYAYSIIIPKLLKNLGWNYLLRTESQIHSNSRSFWKFVCKSRSNSGLPNRMHLDKQLFSEREQILNMFSTYISSVYKPPSSSAAPTNLFLYHTLPRNSYFSVLDIESYLDKHSTNIGTGSNGLSGTFLANGEFMKPLISLFRKLRLAKTLLSERLFSFKWYKTWE